MVKNLGLLLFVVGFSACTTVQRAGNGNKDGVGYTPAQYWDLTAEQKTELKKRGLSGDGKAAWRVGQYYFYSIDRGGINEQETYWMKVSAEDGYPEGMYTYAFSIRESSDPKDIKAAKYWFKKASDAGIAPATSELELLESKHL